MCGVVEAVEGDTLVFAYIAVIDDGPMNHKHPVGEGRQVHDKAGGSTKDLRQRT